MTELVAMITLSISHTFPRDLICPDTTSRDRKHNSLMTETPVRLNCELPVVHVLEQSASRFFFSWPLDFSVPHRPCMVKTAMRNQW